MTDTTYTVRIYDIEWDTDGEEIDDLPSEVNFGHEANERPDDDDPDMIEGINDHLSDTYGWCVSDYQVEVL